ncbi:MAG: alanine racemase, partial [Rhodothermales bacterium]
LRHNTRLLQQQAGRVPLMGVVKADAYGHGVVEVTWALRAEGMQHFAVAAVPEAIVLREAGIEEPILVLGAPLPHHLAAYAQYRLEVTIASRSVAEAVIESAWRGEALRVHLKIDTGMHRLGVPPDEAADVARALHAAPGVTLAGVWTHFATAEQADDPFATEQLACFRATLATMADVLDAYPDVRLHAAGSGALWSFQDSYVLSRPALARPGIALYGLAGDPDMAARVGLRPVMRLLSRVTHLQTVEAGATVSYGRTWQASRPSRIATLGVGYADGYPRRLSNRGEVGIGGRRYPIAGLICMDMLMVDLGLPDGPGADVRIGDEAVLFGEGGPSLFEVAAWAGTIPYEICCGISARVPRWYASG